MLAQWDFYVFPNPFSNTSEARIGIPFYVLFLTKTFFIHLSLAYTIFARVQIFFLSCEAMAFVQLALV